MEHLIESVRKYPCLWNVALRDYKDSELKEAAWQEVTKECDYPNVKETKTLWKKLRDGFRQATSNKKRTTSGQAANSIQKWKYEDQMEFLLPTFRNRPTQTNILTYESQITHNSQVLNESTISTNIEQQTASDSGNDTPQPQKKRHKSIINILESDQKRREKRSVERDILRRRILENNSQNENPNNTAMEKFFMSMCYTTNELPAYLQIKVKKQLFNIVMEAQEQHLMQSSSNATPENIDSHNISVTSLSYSPERADSSACSNYLNSDSNTSHSPVPRVNSPQGPPPRVSESSTSIRPRNTVKTQLIRQFRSPEKIAAGCADPGSPEHRVYFQQSSLPSSSTRIMPQKTTHNQLYHLDQHGLISEQNNDGSVDPSLYNPVHQVDSLKNPPPRLRTSMAPRNTVKTQLIRRFRSPEQRAASPADTGSPERHVLSQQSTQLSSSSSTLVSPQNTTQNHMYRLDQRGLISDQGTVGSVDTSSYFNPVHQDNSPESTPPRLSSPIMPRNNVKTQSMRQFRPFKQRATGSADPRSPEHHIYPQQSTLRTPSSSTLVSPQNTTHNQLYRLDKRGLISEQDTVGSDDTSSYYNPLHQVNSPESSPPRLNSPIMPRNNVKTQLMPQFRPFKQRAAGSADPRSSEHHIYSQQSTLRSSSSSTLVSLQNTTQNQFYHLDQREFISEQDTVGSVDTSSYNPLHQVDSSHSSPPRLNSLMMPRNTVTTQRIPHLEFRSPEHGTTSSVNTNSALHVFSPHRPLPMPGSLITLPTQNATQDQSFHRNQQGVISQQNTSESTEDSQNIHSFFSDYDFT